MKKKFLIGLVLLCVLCGCSDATEEKGGADKNSGETNVSTESKQPTYGGDIVVGLTQDLDSLDPHVAVAAGTDEVLFNIFEGLVKPDQYGNVNPAVASEYKISDDATEYRFTIREGVKFHNGDVVTTEDAVYSLKRCAGFEDVKDPNVLVESALSIVTDIYAEDDRTVVLKLSEPNTELIYYLTCAIIPHDYKDQAKSPVGTGPYKFKSYAPLESFVIERNDDYYGEKPYLDQITFKIFANIDAAFLELLAGSVDIMTELTDEKAAQLETRGYNIVGAGWNLVQALFLNNGAKPFDDIRVRQALCMAIDRQEINMMISGGKGTIIGTGMLPGIKAYYASELTDYYKNDLEAAKKLLADAGYANGLQFTITAPANYGTHVQTAEIIAAQLKKIGVTAKVETVEWSTWLSEVYSGRKYEATIIGLDANLAPSDVLKRYRSTAHNNFVNYVNTEYDEAFNNGLKAVGADEKKTWYKKCQELLTKDAASVYIEDPAKLTAVKDTLDGYTPYPVYVFDAAKIYYTK